MRRFVIVMMVALPLLGLAFLAGAVPSGLSVEFDGQGEGKVTFNGASHAKAGLKCPDCHMGLFYVSRNSQIARGDHRRNEACFACHDGKQAFAARGHCADCHVEPEPLPEAPAG